MILRSSVPLSKTFIVYQGVIGTGGDFAPVRDHQKICRGIWVYDLCNKIEDPETSVARG